MEEKNIVECTCGSPDRPETHTLNANCYVWYQLKLKYRGVENAGVPVLRSGRYDFVFGDNPSFFS